MILINIYIYKQDDIDKFCPFFLTKSKQKYIGQKSQINPPYFQILSNRFLLFYLNQLNPIC